MVRSGLISKLEAKKILEQEIIDQNEEQKLQEYILEKLDISEDAFKEILEKKNLNFKDFNTYYQTFKYFKYPIKFLVTLNLIPKLLYLRYFG